MYLFAHHGSEFDTYFVLNSIPQCRTVVSLIKNGSGIVSLKIFNGNVDENKDFPQYVHFSCEGVHINKLLKKIGDSYTLQP